VERKVVGQMVIESHGGPGKYLMQDSFKVGLMGGVVLHGGGRRQPFMGDGIKGT